MDKKTGCSKSSWSEGCPLYGGLECPATCDRFEPQDADLRDAPWANLAGDILVHDPDLSINAAETLAKKLCDAGWHKCPKKGEWPVLTDEEIVAACGLHSNPILVRRAIAEAQRDADRSRCQAQREGK